MESLSLTDVRNELQKLDIDTSTPGLRGDERREMLVRRLQAARAAASGSTPGNGANTAGRSRQGDLHRSASISSGGNYLHHHPSVNRSAVEEEISENMSMNDVRTKLEACGASTLTPGLSGDERRWALIRRLAAIDSEGGEYRSASGDTSLRSPPTPIAPPDPFGAPVVVDDDDEEEEKDCLLYTSPSPRDLSTSRMPSSA